MTIFNPPKFLTHSLIGAVGLTAIALLGVAEVAHAGKLRAGKDFWKTPEDGGTIEIPDLFPDDPDINGILIPENFFFPGSDPLLITEGAKNLTGHPIEDLMGMLPGPAEQDPAICFDRHGNAVSENSEHVVDCIPPSDPEMDLAWTDTIVERLTDSTQLSEQGDMALIPIQMRMVSLVGRLDNGNCLQDNGCFEVTGGPETVRYFLKATAADEQRIGLLKLTVTGVREMGNMTFIDGIPSIGLDEACALNDDQTAINLESFPDTLDPNNPPTCLGLPVTYNLAFKNADTGELTETTIFSDTLILEDGTQPGNEADVYFTFKKTTPEPSTTLGLLFLGLGSIAGLKRKDKAKK